MVCLRAYKLFKDMKLHENKRKIVKHKFKGREVEYAKEKYIAKKEEKNKKSKFVTQDSFQLQFGYDSPAVCYKYKNYIKDNYISGRINGIPIIKTD
jgi:hypothetical protein